MAKEIAETGELKVGRVIQYAPIVAAGIIFGFVPMAMQASCLGVYYTAVSEGFGCEVSTVTMYLTLGSLFGAIITPIVGNLYAKFDLRIVTSALAVWVAICFIGMALAPSVIVFVLFGALLIPGTVGIFNLGMPTLINRWFKDYAGTLVGICAAFTGFGGVVFIPVGQMVMSTGVDYQTPLFVYAAIVLIACLPLTIFGIRSYPSERGLLPYVSPKSAEKGGGAAAVAHERNWTVDANKVMKTGAFWTLAIAIGLCNMVVLVARFFATYVNELAAAGVAVAVTGALIATILSGGQAVCKVIMGIFSDVIKMKPVVIIASISGIVCLGLIAFFPTTPALPIGAACFGFFYCSTAVVAPLLGGAVLGTGKNFSKAYSRVTAVAYIMGMPAGVMWPLIAENFGGYPAAFMVAMVFIALFAILALTSLKLGEKIERIPDTGEDDEETTA